MPAYDFDEDDPRGPRFGGGGTPQPQPGQAAPPYRIAAPAGGAPQSQPAPGMPAGSSPWQPPAPPMGAMGQGAPINWGALAQRFMQQPQGSAQPQQPGMQSGAPPMQPRGPWQGGWPQQGAGAPPMMNGALQQLAARLAARRQQAQQRWGGGAPQGAPMMNPRRDPER